MDKQSNTGYRKIIVLALSAIGVAAVIVAFSLFSVSPRSGEESQTALTMDAGAGGTSPPATQLKILYVMSYHSPWKWTDDQFNGFKDALAGLDVEYNVFQMDTKRKSTEEWKQEAGRQARDLIETWKPDLVFIGDDNAQKYVTVHYINSSIPFVFCAVNSDPQDYGFVGSTNIAGVLEQEHFVESVKLLKEIVPNVTRIAVITDDDVTWFGVVERMKEKQSQLPDVGFISWDVIYTFEEYKQRIGEYETRADAVALLGIFTFKDENGENVPLEEVARWTAENSSLPEFTFWEDRIYKGHLCTVTVSGYEQGYEAGKIARGILVEGRSPASYPMKPTLRGEPVISLARANRLGIRIKSSTLLTAKIVENFEWEE